MSQLTLLPLSCCGPQLLGLAFVEVMNGDAHGALFRYGADQRLVLDPEGR